MIDLAEIEKETDRRYQNSRAAAFALFAALLTETLARALAGEEKPYMALAAMDARMKKMGMTDCERSRNNTALRGFLEKLLALRQASHLTAFELAKSPSDLNAATIELLRSMNASSVRAARAWCGLNQVEPLTEQQIVEIRGAWRPDQPTIDEVSTDARDGVTRPAPVQASVASATVAKAISSSDAALEGCPARPRARTAACALAEAAASVPANNTAPLDADLDSNGLHPAVAAVLEEISKAADDETEDHADGDHGGSEKPVSIDPKFTDALIRAFYGLAAIIAKDPATIDQYTEWFRALHDDGLNFSDIGAALSDLGSPQYEIATFIEDYPRD